ncbi:hypothetical protein BHM03_00054425 [Ensete ventricosum]|nr:hypothetical protein BHM03_00054425 [Ensete ventricosum]
MASQDSIDAKLEALESWLESRMKDRLRDLFAEFRIGRSPSPTISQQSKSSEMPPEKEEQASDVMQPRMRVDFPRWEGDPTRWLSHAEHWRRAFVGIATNHGAVTIVAKRGTLLIEPIEDLEEVTEEEQ